MELIDLAEESFLKIEEGEDLGIHYDQIFRTFHNIKGSSGMLGLAQLQDVVHDLETRFMSFKGASKLGCEEANYFINGIDTIKEHLSADLETKILPFL